MRAVFKYFLVILLSMGLSISVGFAKSSGGKSYRPKTVTVKSYTKKDGTSVKTYKRAAAKKK